MGWTLKITEEGKYRIWSSIVDDYVCEPMDNEGILRFVFWHRFEKMLRDNIKDLLTFPHDWYDNEGNRILNKEDYDKHHDTIFTTDRELFFNTVFNKLEEIGIDIKMTDVDGVNLYTPNCKDIDLNPDNNE